MDPTIENILATNLRDVRGSLVAFQEETRENFRQVDDRFAQVDARFTRVDGQLADMREGLATLHAEVVRVENNMVNLFTVLFAHLGVALPTDMLK